VSCIHPPQGIQELAWGTAVVRQKITAVLRGKSTFLGVFEGAAGENFEDSGSQTECSRCKIASKSVKNTLEM